MRSAPLPFCFGLLLILWACSTNRETTETSFQPVDLAGTWELREAQHGRMPAAQYAPRNGTRFHFTATTFKYYKNGTLTRSGRYRVVPDTKASASVGLELPAGEFNQRIILDRDSSEKTFIHLRRDTLEMLKGFFPVDAGSRQVFVRTQKGRQ